MQHTNISINFTKSEDEKMYTIVFTASKPIGVDQLRGVLVNWVKSFEGETDEQTSETTT